MKKTVRKLALVLLLVGVSVLAFAGAAGFADEEEKPAARPALAPSWRDQGTAAVRAKDYVEAIFLYRKWLEADPRDQNTWYNLACCYALAGQGDAAIQALERAVDAGWTDAAWPLEDPDLESVRDDERFRDALARAEALVATDAPDGFERHLVKIETIGTYVAMLPPDYAESEGHRYPLVVILHGNGSTELQHGRLSDRLGREGVIYVAPRAPYPNHGVFLSMRQPGWTWRPEDLDEDAVDPLGPARLYVDSILAAVDDATKRYRVKGEKFHVLGHSMGGFFANVTAVLEPARVASFFAYAGGLPEEFHAEKWLTPLKEHGVKAFLGHGEADPVVPATLSKKAYDLLKGAGVEATIHLFPEQDHGIGEHVATAMQAWRHRIVLGNPPEDGPALPGED